MKNAILICSVFLLGGCSKLTITTGDSISSDELEAFFREHKVDGNPAVALKKSSFGVASYLATIHGYPDNMAVCDSLIEPYNKGSSKPVVSGTYYCQELK